MIEKTAKNDSQNDSRETKVLNNQQIITHFYQKLLMKKNSNLLTKKLRKSQQTQSDPGGPC